MTTDWRLSRIDEELEKVHFSNQGLVSHLTPVVKAGTLPRRSAQTAWDNDIYGLADDDFRLQKNSSSTGDLDKSDNIYSKAVVRPALSGDKLLDSKQAIKYITGKYDSLGRVKSGGTPGFGQFPPPGLTASKDQSPDSQFGSAEFPPPPPECLFPARDSPPPPRPLVPTSVSNAARIPTGIIQTQPRGEPPRPSQQYEPPRSTHTGEPRRSSLQGEPQRPSYVHHVESPRPLHQGEPQRLSQQGEPQRPSQQGESPRPISNGQSHIGTAQEQAQRFFKDEGHGYVPAITEQEILQVDMFYRSHKTEVFVCHSLANLYFGGIRGCGTPSKAPCRLESGQWQFYKSGVPVLVLDSGGSRRKRKLSILLAERGTGFTLWRDAMNHLSNYSSPQNTFHTLHLSNDHTKLAGFRFVDSTAAIDFYHRIYKLASDPNDDILNLSAGKNKKKVKTDKKKYKAPSKADISTPCCFTHVTKLDSVEGAPSVTNKNMTSSMHSMPTSPVPPSNPRSMSSSYS